MKILEINVLVLAYLGDGIYENYVREKLIWKHSKVNEIQKEAISYVSAKAQASYLDQMMEEGFFSEEEISIIKRARNHKGGTVPKNVDVIAYKKATGLEALVAYLYLENKKDRLDEIMERIIS